MSQELLKKARWELSRKGGSVQDAEDVVQEAIEKHEEIAIVAQRYARRKLWGSIENLEEAHSCEDKRRLTGAGHRFNPSRSVQEMEDYRIAKERLTAALSGRAYRCLELAGEGWDDEEIASTTGQTVGAVNRMLNRARDAAKEVFDDRVMERLAQWVENGDKGKRGWASLLRVLMG